MLLPLEEAAEAGRGGAVSEITHQDPAKDPAHPTDGGFGTPQARGRMQCLGGPLWLPPHLGCTHLLGLTGLNRESVPLECRRLLGLDDA